MNMHHRESSNSNSTTARLVVLLGVCLVAFILAVPLSRAQIGQGKVTGTVTDLSQAIVPNANVTLTNTETGVVSKSQSSDVGLYYFGAVPIGQYKIEVQKEGFEQWVGTFTLAVGQTAVVNPSLKVGSSKTVVEVTGAAALIETQSGAVGDVKESSQIRDLPLNGRQIGGLFNLTAGVESGSGGARVNGMKVGSLDINMDGASLVNRFGGGMVTTQPGIETIQEFRIDTVGSDARFAQPATVVMATRSGTNQLHGAGYEYLRDNSVIGVARLRTDPTTGFTQPKLIRNEFGGYISGPVYIPHIYNGKDKAFWFFDYEGLRQQARSGGPLEPYVPTAAMWQGDLSNAIDPNNGDAPIIIYDPKSTGTGVDPNPPHSPGPYFRTPFPNNQIPGPLSVTAAALKGLTALPCCGPTADNNPYVASNFNLTYPQIQTNNTFTPKWDQNISEKDRLSVRYTRATQTSLREGGYYANPADPSSGMGSSVRNYAATNVSVNYNRTISPNWLNELLVGVLRVPNHSGTAADFTNWAEKLGTPNPFNVTGWPTMYTTEASGYYMGWDSDNNKQQHLTSETVDDNVTWTHGKHTVQFGFHGRMEQNNIEELQQAQGNHGWANAYTVNWDPSAQWAAVDTGSGFAELLLGLPNMLSNQYNRGFFYFRQTMLGMYVNDKIKLSPRLTLNLGLRWDYFTPYTEARNRMALPYAPDQAFSVMTPGSVDMTSLGIPSSALDAWQAIGLSWKTADSAGYPSNLFNPIHNDFGPRLGLAYQLNPKTVLRGSYGIYYVPEPLNLLLQSMRTNPPLNLRYVNNPYLNPNVPGGTGGSYYGTYPLIVTPASTDYMPPATVDITGGGQAPVENNTITAWDAKNWKDSRAQTWNFTVERELPGRAGLRLSYIGTYGGNLLQNYAINDPEPNYNYAMRTGLLPPSDTNKLRGIINWGVIADNHTGYSRSHSFQTEIHRTFSSGIAFQAFYTFNRQLGTDDPSGASLSSTSINGGSGSGHLGGNGGAAVPESFELQGEPNVPYKQRLRLVYFNSTTIPPHNVTFNGIYDLPFGKGKHFARNVSTPLNYLIGGWQVATIGVWHSGLWMGANPAYVQPGSIFIPANQRAKLTQKGSKDQYVQWFAGNFSGKNATSVQGSLHAAVARQFGPNCSGAYVGQLAVTLADGSCYNSGASFYNPAPRNNIIGPGAWNDDFSLYKHIKVGERVDFRFAADFFNFFNHPNNAPPNASTGLQDVSTQDTTLNGPRQVQLSLRVEF